jgi:hypothetical protein
MSDNPLGSASQFAWGFEASNGVPDLASLFGLLVASEAFAPKIGSEATKNISPIDHILRNVRVKTESGGNLERQPDVDSIVRMRAHYQGWTAITNPVGGVYSWLCRPENVGVDTPLANYIDTLYARRYTDDDYEERIDCGKIGKTMLKIEKNKIIDLSQQIFFGTTTHFDEPSEIAVNVAYTGQLVFRGWNDETDTRKLRLKATVPGALDGTAKVEGTYAGTGTIATSATSTATGTGTKFLTEYVAGDLIMVGTETVRTVNVVTSNTSMTVTVAFSNTASGLAHWIDYGGVTKRMPVYSGVWQDFIDSKGKRVGANYPHAKVEFMYTAGGVFTTSDEWQCLQQRGKTTVSFVQKQPLTAVGCALTIGGSEVEVEGATIEMDRPREPYFAVGHASARRVNDNGQRMATVAIKRRYLDRTFLRLARSGAKVSFAAAMRGDRIGSTAYYEGWDIAAPNWQIDDAGNDGIKGPNAYDEEIKGTLYYDPNTAAVPITETLTTTVPTIAP